MTVYADDLQDLFDQFEHTVEQMHPPEKIVISGNNVKELFAYRLMKIVIALKKEDKL